MEIKSEWYNKKHIWVEIANEEEKKKFLSFAKGNGFTWMNGDEIKPESDGLGYHFGLNSDKKMGYVSIWCWNLGKDKKEVTVMPLETLLMQNELFMEE